MVNSISENNYGNIQRIGISKDNRVIYRVIDSNGKDAGKMTVAKEDMDKFEKSYVDIMSTAPKIHAYVGKNSSPEALQKRRTLSSVCVGLGGLIGTLIPVLLTKKSSLTAKIVSTVAGLITGIGAGFAVSLSMTTPPGAFKFAKAARTLSNIDLKPYADSTKVGTTRM